MAGSDEELRPHSSFTFVGRSFEVRAKNPVKLKLIFEIEIGSMIALNYI